MELNETFYTDENGNIVYTGDPASDGTDAASSPEILESGDGSGVDVVENDGTGTEISYPLEGEEVSSAEEEAEQGSSGGDTYNVSLLSDEVQAVVVDALSPASGAIGSSTLDYFDRVVSGLPSDYVYIAYRTDSNDSYSGVLYYSENYELSDNLVTFEDDTHVLEVYRTSSGNYNYVTYYDESVIDGSSIAYDLSGSVLYYTNASVGYPVLGGKEKPLEVGLLLCVGLLTALAVTVLSKIFKR